MSPKKRLLLGVGALLAIQIALGVGSAREDSQTVDEAVHLASGYTYLTRGDFRLNPEHPPLLKELAALPLLFTSVRAPLEHASWREENQWEFGRQFLYQNSLPAQDILLLGRIPIILLTASLGVLVFHWSKELFGLWGGFLSLLLYAFDPNIIAHGHLVTTDVGVMVFFVLSIYSFTRVVQKPTLGRAALFGFVVGLAELAKFSALLLWPILAILLIAAWFHPAGAALRALSHGRRALLMGIFLAAVFGTVWAAYGFEFRMPASHPRVAALYEERARLIGSDGASIQPAYARPLVALTDDRTTIGRWILRAGQTMRVPLVTYLRGVAGVAAHNAFGHETYARGRYSTLGFWWYFPFAVLVKTPAGILVLLPIIAVALFRWIRAGMDSHRDAWWSRGRLFTQTPFSILVLLTVPLLFFLASMTSRINLGIRHVLLIYPFLFILAGSLLKLRLSKTRQRVMTVALAILVSWVPLATLAIHPYELAFFNEFAGGPKKGYRHLLDSNLDWGQGLVGLQRYLREHPPVAGRLALAYFGSAEIESYARPTIVVPEYLPDDATPLPGTYVVSASLLFNQTGEYAWLRRRIPTAVIGYALFAYDFPNR